MLEYSSTSVLDHYALWTILIWRCMALLLGYSSENISSGVGVLMSPALTAGGTVMPPCQMGGRRIIQLCELEEGTMLCTREGRSGHRCNHSSEWGSWLPPVRLGQHPGKTKGSSCERQKLKYSHIECHQSAKTHHIPQISPSFCIAVFCPLFINSSEFVLGL